ncbi:MAG: hypothetical protein U0736_08790 [Gemmataceae bacterium]
MIADYLAGPFDPQETLEGGAGGFGGFPVLTGPRWCVVVLDAPLPADVAGSNVELTMNQSAASNSGFQACTLRKFTPSASTDARWTGAGGGERSARLGRGAGAPAVSWPSCPARACRCW